MEKIIDYILRYLILIGFLGIPTMYIKNLVSVEDAVVMLLTLIGLTLNNVFMGNEKDNI